MIWWLIGSIPPGCWLSLLPPSQSCPFAILHDTKPVTGQPVGWHVCLLCFYIAALLTGNFPWFCHWLSYFVKVLTLTANQSSVLEHFGFWPGFRVQPHILAGNMGFDYKLKAFQFKGWAFPWIVKNTEIMKASLKTFFKSQMSRNQFEILVVRCIWIGYLLCLVVFEPTTYFELATYCPLGILPRV